MWGRTKDKGRISTKYALALVISTNFLDSAFIVPFIIGHVLGFKI
jgi:hypothetical protein